MRKSRVGRKVSEAEILYFFHLKCATQVHLFIDERVAPKLRKLTLRD